METITKENQTPLSYTLRHKEVLRGNILSELGYNPSELEGDNLTTLISELEKHTTEVKIEIRADPLFGEHTLHNTLISEKRAKRPGLPKKEEYTPRTTCDFCGFSTDNPKKEGLDYTTGIPKIFHKGGAISVPNLCPYIHPHFVTILTREHDLSRHPSLEDITVEMMENFLGSGRELVQNHIMRYFNPNKVGLFDIVGMWDFINWGIKAGGTQPHPHAQRGALYGIMKPLMKKEYDILHEHHTDKDPFEELLEFVREQSLMIYEDDHVAVFAPFAPRFTDQVDIVTKKSKGFKFVTHGYENLLEDDVKAIASPLARTLNLLGQKRGVQNANILTHQSYFSPEYKDYRMHWHICPRDSLIGGMELNDLYVVSVYPEYTAEVLRKSF